MSDMGMQILVAVTCTGTLSSIATFLVLLLPVYAKGPFKSMQFVLVAILAFFNFVEAVTFAVGPAPIPVAGEAIGPGCVAQASIMQFCSVASFSWIVFFCFTLVKTVHGKEQGVLSQPATPQKVLPALAATCAVALTTCIVLGAAEVYGDSTFWCWVDDANYAIWLYYLPLVIIWAIAIAAIGIVARAVLQRVRLAEREVRKSVELQQELSVNVVESDRSSVGGMAGKWLARMSLKRATAHTETKAKQLRDFRSSTIRQLTSYILVFIVFSTFGLANRLRRFVTGQPSPDYLVLLQAWTMPLQGLANAIVFGIWLKGRFTLRCWRSVPDGPGSEATVSRKRSTLSRHPSAALACPTATASLFAATWNVGEGPPPPHADLARWLPAGRDVYLIGLQECLDPKAWNRAVSAALGGGYTCIVERMIGSTATAMGYHGFILLLTFVKREVLSSGAWYEVKSGKGATVKRGTKIGAGARASNKGAVGAAFRFHKQTIAVVSCHLAADKKGKVNKGKRLEDLRHTLEGLQLEYDDWDIDLQNACHHVILLGDLNFRVALPAATAVNHLCDGEGAKLLAAEELQAAMATQDVLHGFVEASSPASFLPSFRRIEGQRVTEAEADGWRAGRSNVFTTERVEALYSLAASDGTERTPSWTDRILLHSLPGLRDSLTCESYSADESLVISDHRPVGAALWLVANKALVAQVEPLRCTVTLSKLSIEWWRREGGDGAAVKRIELTLPLPSETTGNAVKRVQSIIGEGEDLSHASVPWSRAAATGVLAFSDFDAPEKVHALANLIGGSGSDKQCLGQAVLAVPDVTTSAVALEAQLTTQGRLVGMLKGEIAVTWNAVERV